MPTSWMEKYRAALGKKPEPGAILRPSKTPDIEIKVELKPGEPPFLFVNAAVPCEVDSPTNWCTTDQKTGIKCIFMARSRQQIIERYGLETPPHVKAIRVVRESESKQSLLVEVAEW